LLRLSLYLRQKPFWPVRCLSRISPDLPASRCGGNLQWSGLSLHFTSQHESPKSLMAKKTKPSISEQLPIPVEMIERRI